MPMLVASLDLNQLVLVIAGGIIYSLGAIGYGFKVPKLVPMTFGFHEFFHLLVIIAASLHFIVIYGLL
jgi:hemolysin III